jgi:hypothetical protein
MEVGRKENIPRTNASSFCWSSLDWCNNGK